MLALGNQIKIFVLGFKRFFVFKTMLQEEDTILSLQGKYPKCNTPIWFKL